MPTGTSFMLCSQSNHLHIETMDSKINCPENREGEKPPVSWHSKLTDGLEVGCTELPVMSNCAPCRSVLHTPRLTIHTIQHKAQSPAHHLFLPFLLHKKDSFSWLAQNTTRCYFERFVGQSLAAPLFVHRAPLQETRCFCLLWPILIPKREI